MGLFDEYIRECLIKKLRARYPNIDRIVEMVDFSYYMYEGNYAVFEQMGVENVDDFLIKLYQGDRLAKRFYFRCDFYEREMFKRDVNIDYLKAP